MCATGYTLRSFVGLELMAIKTERLATLKTKQFGENVVEATVFGGVNSVKKLYIADF